VILHIPSLYLEGIEFNPRRLDQVEERLALIHSLKRKFGETNEEILDFAQAAQKQLEEISTSAERLLELENERDSLVETLGETGWALSGSIQLPGVGTAGRNRAADLQMSNCAFR
jgi:DNA repair protein RecN (Recombination protein N)